jgi:hypothetical protein
VIGADVLDVEALVVGVDGCELDVGVLVVGVVGFGALGRPLPFPCASAFMAGAMTRAMARAAVSGNERFVTVPLGESGPRSKGKEHLHSSPLTFDF